MAHKLSSGIIPAAILPFHADGEIDWETLDSYIEQVAQGGPRGIAMNMDASEGFSLTFDEQLAVIERCARVLKGSDVALVSGLLSTHTRQAITLSRQLVDAGADALCVFPTFPTHLGVPSQDMIVDYHAAVQDAVDVPLIAFKVFPSMARWPAGTIAEVAKLKNVVAMKEATFDISETRLSLLEAHGENRIGVLTGSDTFILEAMLIGCDGALIGFASAFTAEVVKMQQFAEIGNYDAAYEIWDKLGPLARFGWSPPTREYRARMKYMLELQGVIPCSKIREPALSPSADEMATIRALFDEHGLRDERWLPAGKKPAFA